MIFRQLFDNQTSTYTYLIASDYGKESIIIDPVDSKIDSYIQLLSELSLKLVYSIDTHVHADHVTGSGLLMQQTNCKIIMGKQSKAENISLKANENEPIKIDNLTIQPIYTPGHTDDSYCFLLNNMVFTGDTLLIRGTGRTDFQNGNPFSQYDSIFNKLLTLPDQTLVYPGHDYNGNTVSTIFEERLFNPRLQIKSKDEYAELMSNINLPKPKNIDIAVPKNLNCGM
ncbi:Zn-dependent hydrolase [Piscirickettsia salmonis]|uniref:Beta-lactamase hydrolase-like protein n=1 Tax=Piscirickettsia salmonis TaxID=1238 RepID=A0A9Q6PXR4_PISSA|nr:MBL fold metallo-hydrolase [Piscirickettsia salmonis]ALA24340.1 metallo-beta-lactamase superfamily protein [Piscirickettsia salmonis]APS44713.1 Zn-dependent hydrolase [Piscirickettsia salmonis]APS48073.1 Zn-dependent hydrolase [Piscirickettsia salmonis]APS52029.1 Zn-dependent hydrolase [Piscirickettsia salmonis]APS55247.1 Zn-dependent hydrolase [Piscirickettsia salmonis]